jgi:uncharacterized protein (TIGR02246 family)
VCIKSFFIKECPVIRTLVFASRFCLVALMFFGIAARAQDVSVDQAQIYAWMANVINRWNAHDIDGYMANFWQSENFVYILDGEEITGWGNLRAAYHAGYPDVSAMGTVDVQRTQVEMVTPDVALAIDWWTVRFPSNQSRAEHGTTTFTMRKFDDGWKAVAFHSSFIEF